MSDIVLWGFDGSTYVRTVKMVLAKKGVAEYKQVPLNVLKGDPKTPEHRERHPFGKVPVLDHDGARILETTAIARYLNDVLPGKSLIPSTPKDRARMDMVIGLINSYGYGALIGGVAAYHLFPVSSAGRTTQCEKNGLENSYKNDGTRYEDEGLFSLHRRRLKSRRSLSRADCFLRFTHVGQRRAVQCPTLCGW